jgi:threonine synthase
MKFYSLHRSSPSVTFREAVIRGQAPDGGLYFPEKIPQQEKIFLDSMEKFTSEEIAVRVMKPFTGDDIDEESLFSIIQETISFPIPLVQISEDIWSLELFHGPTLAFKDVGARFMSRCLEYFIRSGFDNAFPEKNNGKKMTILVATSGDTGSAVAHGFFNVKGIEVVILYPAGKVSPVQEKQLTTLGGNVQALEMEGTFDDCQQLVKTAFADTEICRKLFLTSANSINIARWLPQQIYYFLAYKQWPHKNHPLVISVPSGNFGNLAAGMLALKSGLPVRHFIAACNSNDVVPKFLQTNQYVPRQAQPTLSNAMDVGDPSNFSRILAMYDHDLNSLRRQLSAYSISDEETVTALAALHQHHHYLADPHGAVGYLSLKKYLQQHQKECGIFLETAHPVKFPEAVEKATGLKTETPPSLAPVLQSEKKSIRMKAEYKVLKDFLMK